MTTMQVASQYDKSAFVKVFHTRANSVKGTTTLLSKQQCPCSKLRSKNSFLYRIQGFGVDHLVGGGGWTLFRITSLLQISVIYVLFVL